MTKIDTIHSMSQMLESYDSPAILVTAAYEILASNAAYKTQFGEIDLAAEPKCHKVSHGYSKPCDLEGEDCPLKASMASKKRERVLHIHQTPNGKEHVDVELIPILNKAQELQFFIELLKPVPLASGKTKHQTMIGSSPAFNNMLSLIAKVSSTDANVLLQGESGSGKELASQAIHLNSQRKDKPLVTLECAGLSEALIESELFGHVKGAFTGANVNKIGLVEQAHGGTLFLDEIGDVSLETQVKLLRLIETKSFRQVGGTDVRTSNFRLICATHRNLTKMVQDGEFRLDLYYRINVFPIHIPALQDRGNDVAELAQHMLAKENKSIGISDRAIAVLRNHHYQGNIRELRNIISRAVILTEDDQIDQEAIRTAITLDAKADLEKLSGIHQPQAIPSLKDLERDFLNSLMQQFDQDKTKVAKAAGISLRTLYRKLD